jgi:CDP-paratose 2-epimerase
LPLVELETRFELSPDHPFAENGIPEHFTVDQSKHSLFGVSKLSADVYVQEYARYFGMKTVVFRGGCLTGPGHSGTQLHGFLSYLVRCAVEGRPYTVIGYGGKQVRDNIHSQDLVRALWAAVQDPRPGSVYNIGGGRVANCSVIEAIRMAEEITQRRMQVKYDDTARSGDHIWWISDLSRFRADYPDWNVTIGIEQTLREIAEKLSTRLQVAS